ncbi:NAD-dependent epimerase/dehydratase family protein [Actinacidiphila sp. DG2A-62]|uniref:NAD-dependent epimerase/dehydratase family protein n=1 Tax=Actinacidiphila sp. DG2A-62 TaxID=3108821 RepID=UPI002DBDE68F|nr:NAD-dependent epimerase/dehydratase family protein [Actinacidiphila sp. DG2A-62]MEC3993826.1 NAD-dependent epimerase/dehydratase family protein [Actinacidiphila sp. DG2A-62]
MTDRVLVTGISGFIGGHLAAELLRRGYAVRGSVRSPARVGEVHAAMAAAGVDTAGLDICRLDLLSDQGWAEACDGCRYALHVASPFVLTKPKDPAELIRPAVEGATRAVGAALDAGVERVVMTSSLATVQFARAPEGHVYTDADWTDPDDPRLNAYTVSKVRAERAARELVRQRGVPDRLALINPGAVIGPLLTNDPGTSVTAIQQIMAGALPMIPDLRLPWADVRDIADAHIAAMTSPSAAGRRTIVATDPMSLIEVARVIRERLPEASRKVPARAMPTWFTWLASVFEPQLRDNRWLIGQKQRFDRTTAEALLGHPLRSIPDAIEQTGRSLAEHQLI